MCTLIGDVLLSAAFLTYCGPLDQGVREDLISIWKLYIKSTIIPIKEDLSLPEFLSAVDDRLDWVSKGLPTDFLCVENAIVLNHYERYPLIIDPSGQVFLIIMILNI